jgi:hypothetical protein
MPVSDTFHVAALTGGANAVAITAGAGMAGRGGRGR